MEHLVESALLTHGLKSVTNEEIRRVWTDRTRNITWISKGEIVVGTMEQYLDFRIKTEELSRIDCQTLEKALREGVSGALTASGTMAVCKKYGIPFAVTCGMGGIGDIKGEELCPDLPALAESPTALVSAGPKDMLDVKGTIDWLTGHGVTVLGASRDYFTGYLFAGGRVELQGVYDGKERRAPLLIIQEIPEDKRIPDKSVLEKAVSAGKRAEQEGKYYHPAVNGKIDELTGGYSSRIQLDALLSNVLFAKKRGT